MDEGILQLVSAIQDVAPMVWAVTMKQVAIEAMYAGWWLVLCVVLAAIPGVAFFWGLFLAVLERYDEDLGFMLMLLGGMGFLILMVLVLCAHQNWITYIQNPEYMAIQKLLRQVK